MKRYIIASAIVLCIIGGTMCGLAQQLPKPAYFPGAKVNLVRSWDAAAPELDAENLTLRPLKDVKQATQYFDGLGRPLQTVVKKGSLVTSTGTNVDLITANIYDEYGREKIKYLPFTAIASDGSQSNGLFKLDPFLQQVGFYNAQLAGQPGETNVGVNNLNWAYNQTNFEPSPLNRVTESFAPGSSWVGSAGQTQEANRRSVKMNYYVNTASDVVRIWTVTNSSQSEIFGTYSSASNQVYATGTLYKTIIEDENGKQVVEFKDKEGKVVLKKVQLTATSDDGSGSGHIGWLCTYYIYDDLNRLRCVIQPKGVELIANDAASSSWVLTTSILTEQTFRYEYDYRGRMIMKRLPGAAEAEWMVYDKRDRLVMVKNHFLGAYDKWLVTLYDELNRPVQTGFLADSYFQTDPPSQQNPSFQYILDAAKVSEAFPFSASATPSTSVWEYLTKTGYDNYDDIPGSSALTGLFDNNWANHYLTPYNTTPLYAQQPEGSNQTRGMVTWTEVKQLNVSPNAYMYTVNIYDEKGRVVQVKANNTINGKTTTTTQYSWSGQPLIVIQSEQKVNAPVNTTLLVTKMSYDELGRVVKIEKNIGNTLLNSNTMSGFATVSTMEYDALGQLKAKTIGNKKDPTTGQYFAARQPLQELNYDYNVRGWMLGMNRDYLSTEGQTSDGRLFGFELGYDQQENKAGRDFTASQFNGNITGMLWKSDGDDTRRKYDFGYDAVNRLMLADFEQQNPDDHAWNKQQVNYSMKMGDGADPTKAYDANGNILRMQQWGLKLGGSEKIDDLQYTYYFNSNKLKSVTDFTSDPLTKLGDFRTSTIHPQNAAKSALTPVSTPTEFNAITDYYYDGAGNLLRDLNKDIGKTNTHGMAYNHLNQVRVVSLYKADGTSKGSIIYTYDAVGNKLKKAVTESDVPIEHSGNTYTGNISTTTTYSGSFIYESKTYANPALSSLAYSHRLQYILHEEGRIRVMYNNPSSPNTPTGFEYDYMIKDHLGNVRMMLTEESKPAAIYQATMEMDKRTDEEQLFTQIPETEEIPKPPGFDSDGDNEIVSKLFNSGTADRRLGPGVVLKVMAGDKFKALTYGWYQPNATQFDPLPGASSIVNSVISAFTGGMPAGVGHTGEQLTTTGVLDAPANFFVNTYQPAQSSGNRPKAYLNWVILDEEQFKLVEGNYGAVQIPEITDTQEKQVMQANNGAEIEVKKNGYLYVYVSNESQGSVYFDDIRVEHIRGSLIEETHYYPFGLTMAGISSKALAFGNPENKRKWNKGSELESKEFSDGSGLELYSTQYRSLDPQLGRFWQIDPRPDYSQSLYSSMSNNPIRFNDPLGDSINNPRDQRTAARIEAGINRQITRNTQSITNSQNTIAGNNAKLTKLRADVASGSLAGKDLKSANKEIGKLEKSNASANTNITEMQGQNAQLNQSLGDIANLRNDVNFNYTFGGAPGFGSGEHGVLRGSGNDVIIQGSNDGLYVHEIRHIGQSMANGGLRFSTSSATLGRLINAGSPDRARSNAFEVDTYQAQFSFDRNSYPAPGGARVLSDINVTSLRTIIGDSGGILY